MTKLAASLLSTGAALFVCLTANIVFAAQPVAQKSFVTSDADKRDLSPLRAIAKPFDFKDTTETAMSSPQETDPDDELAERARISSEARALYTRFKEAERAKLEELLERYRSQKDRTQSGVWKLTRAYDFLRNLMPDWTYQPDPGTPDWNKDTIAAWKAEYPQSPSPYIIETAIAYYKTTAYLRDPLARTTYEGGIPALKADINKARENLEAHKDIASRDPHYYAMLIMLMRIEGANIDEIIQVAYESSERYPDYFDAYFKVTEAIGSLSRDPTSDIEALANTALEKTKAQLGDEIYARIYWNAIQTVFGLENVGRLKWNWPRMKDSMKTVATRYPVQWNIQNFAQFACVMGDAESTQRFIAQTRGLPMANVWSQVEFYEACKQFAEAKLNPAVPETRKAKAP